MSHELPKNYENNVTTEWLADSKSFVLHISGDFTSEISHHFRNAYQAIKHTPNKYILNMKDTTYIDSTALGMILELREHAHNRKASIHITNMNDVVLDIFKVLNFHKLIKPEYTRDFYKNSEWAISYVNQHGK